MSCFNSYFYHWSLHITQNSVFILSQRSSRVAQHARGCGTLLQIITQYISFWSIPRWSLSLFLKPLLRACMIYFTTCIIISLYVVCSFKTFDSLNSLYVVFVWKGTVNWTDKYNVMYSYFVLNYACDELFFTLWIQYSNFIHS